MKLAEKAKLVDLTVEEIYEAFPDLIERFGQRGKDKTAEDNYHHLDHLETAYQMDNGAFFLDYSRWLKNVLNSRGIGTEIIIDNYERLIKSMDGLPFEDHNEKASYISYLKESIDELSQPPK